MSRTTKVLIGILAISFCAALVGHYVLHLFTVSFFTAATALILLSKFLGVGTESLAHHVGEHVAGFINVTLSNLAEIIIMLVAVKAGKIALVQAGIAGSIFGNLLLVMGLSIYLGCKRNGTMKLKPGITALYINQFFLVGATLFIPTMFNDNIPEHRQLYLSYILAAMLLVAYIYYVVLAKRDSRLDEVKKQHEHIEHELSKKASIIVLVSTAIGAFFMSEILVADVEHVAHSLHLSEGFIGFMLLPILGNIAEHAVAVTAARKGMAELSLSISVGSASQVGMVVAPAAVLFGFLFGNPVTLHFSAQPLELVILSFIGAFLVLHDNEWKQGEGAMLVAFYIAMLIGFAFTS
ncbi:MAG: hypothetical protein WCV85_04665 [Patescibacteria group bacterium]